MPLATVLPTGGYPQWADGHQFPQAVAPMGAVPVSTSLADGRRPCMQCLCQQTLPLWAPTPCGLVAGERRPLSAGSERSPLAVALATCDRPWQLPWPHAATPAKGLAIAGRPFPRCLRYKNVAMMEARKRGGCPWPGPLHGWPTTAGPLQGWPNAASAANKGSGHPRLARKGRRLPTAIPEGVGADRGAVYGHRPFEGSGARPPTEGSSTYRRGSRPWLGRPSKSRL
ncbi:hypothetical protein GW17_00055982 [Ensete ventricosum]|nr:hypothetical protein GW17_00055982 [Ensete ventricosum]